MCVCVCVCVCGRARACACVIFNPWVIELNAWFNLQQTRIYTRDALEGCLRVVITRPVPHSAMWTSHSRLEICQFQCHRVNNTINSERKDYAVLKKCAIMLCVLQIHIVIIFVITFMQGIYNYIPETNHVSRVQSVAAVLYLQFVLQVMLFHPWNMFCTFTLVLSKVCVRCPIWLFFVVPWFQASQHVAQEFLNDYEIVTVPLLVLGLLLLLLLLNVVTFIQSI